MSLLKFSMDRTWSQNACPGICFHGYLGVVSKLGILLSEERTKTVPKGASTWLSMGDHTLAQDTSLGGHAMESEGRAGFLRVAKDRSFDIGTKLRAHSGGATKLASKWVKESMRVREPGVPLGSLNLIMFL